MIQLVFDAPGPEALRLTVRVLRGDGVPLAVGSCPLDWAEKVSHGRSLAINCEEPHEQHVAKHSPAEFCDCENPRPGRPFHCAVGVPGARPVR